MIKCYKFNKIGCLNLSNTCLIFGTIELILSLCVILVQAINYHDAPKNEYLFTLIISAIGFCTCFLMIIGSTQSYRWLLLPHIVFISLYIIGAVIWGLTFTGLLLELKQVSMVLLSVVVWSWVIIIAVFYWNVLLNRFLEITEESIPSPYPAEIEFGVIRNL